MPRLAAFRRSALLLPALLAGACAGRARLALPDDLAAAEHPVDGPGWWASYRGRGEMRFGDVHVRDIARSATSRAGRRAVQTYSFHVVAPADRALRGSCETEAGRPYRGQWGRFIVQATTVGLFCRFTGEDGSDVGTLGIFGASSAPRSGGATSPGVGLALRSNHAVRWSRDDGTVRTAEGVTVRGYDVLADNQAVGAAQTSWPRVAWLREDAPAEVRRLATAAVAALLLFDDVTEVPAGVE